MQNGNKHVEILVILLVLSLNVLDICLCNKDEKLDIAIQISVGHNCSGVRTVFILSSTNVALFDPDRSCNMTRKDCIQRACVE